ncbi:structural maintenance of chromosomes flexible hinge domain-containing protein 1 [Parambassis ranga]|uniref:Structural maintenance of chromosomes flexible hinge domain-containing protein 1 n=1 Tax=Parambassis ranga TaxID=210632 RepID=A0A6P7KFU4_9TELE|nr:structural maintenance of chromosomes flexible hinge domain-containing protein 1 [Parambassis ranga]
MQSSGSVQRGGKSIRVYDFRSEKKTAKCCNLETTGLDFNRFVQLIRKEFQLRKNDVLVLTTTDRKVLTPDRFENLPDGSTIYLLKQKHQDLPCATEEQIDFTPHYNTLTKSGASVYYASEDQKSLPYALAELIDNSLSATSKNKGVRTVEIQMMFDETFGKPAVIVLDNGCGMTSKQLNNWAVYRLSKFMRENSTVASENEGYVRPDPVPRSLNSDMSYFGVGGKQAAFHIGSSVRMISKPVGSPDVHELILSKDEFERKEKNKEYVYKEVIRNRKPGDSTHVKEDERCLRPLIAEEVGKESFTAVVITGVKREHIISLKNDFNMWTRELAHIYHYYIHGVNGNDMSSCPPGSDNPSIIDIQITLREKPNKCPCAINLREVESDMQTQYINAAKDTFEFRASTGPDNGTVEGILRYHPFLYDKETYPEDPSAKQDTAEEDDLGVESGLLNKARGKRPIFECFWNGRLIPYTTVFEFDWCSQPSKGATLPPECYSRFSGVLFTDDRFEVSTNKLKFMDLEIKLRNKDTIFSTVVKGQKSAKRSNIQKEFTQWLQSCHEKYDKQVKFLGFKETITREDVPTKKIQHPWATFSSIEWDKKIYKIGQHVKSQKTQTIMYGTVARFLLFGNHDGDVYATGGLVELIREPRALYNQTKVILISKIDRTATDEAIRRHIDNDLAKLPEKLIVDWPEKNPWPQKAVYPAGTPLGPFKVEILDKNGKSLSRMPTGVQATGLKLSIKLQVTLHDGKEDKVVIHNVALHSPKWGFWFNKIENLSGLGKYTLTMNTMISDTSKTEYGERPLPSYKLNFTIKEGNAESFVVGELSPSFYVGVPFDISLLIKDRFGHSTTPPPKLQPELKCRALDLDLSCMTVGSCGSTVTIGGVRAKGKVLVHTQSKTHDLEVTLPGLREDTQIITINLLPGNPHSIHVTPEENPVQVENGNMIKFTVEIHDEAGNITARPKQIVRCQVPGLPLVTADCSSTGAGLLVTKPINLKIIKGEPQKLQVQFTLISHKRVAPVEKELEVLPSTRVAMMELYCRNDENLVLRNNEKIEWAAGGVLENLYYRLYDEAGREVPLTAETASKIKVNWTNRINQKALIQGKLPDVHVAEQVKDERFYQVSYQDQSVSISFTVVPHPDEPTRLRATLPHCTVKLGEILPGDIKLELVDRHDNATKTLKAACVRHMTVGADGLDKSAIAFTWQESSSSVVLTGVCFNAGSLGPRELCFRYSSYVERTTIKVTAGLPAQLKLVSEPEQPLQVLNDHRISTPFLIQLCDNWGNPSPDQRVVVKLKSSPQTLKVMAAVTSQPVNAKGQASFNVTSVSGPKGYYQLEFKGLFNNKPIPGPSVNLTIIPDPHKPVRLAVNFDTYARFLAGGIFPVFSVTVVSDEGSPITSFNPAAVSMFVWKKELAVKLPPPTAIELKCSKPMENERSDCFYFRDKNIPEHAGEYILQFSLHIDTNKQVLHSEQISVPVVANHPVKLEPSTHTPTPVVSCSSTSQTLVENLTLRIMDSYGNQAGQDLDGQVVAFIKCPNEEINKSLPLFEGTATSCHISLVEGKAHITRLAIKENSPGEDSSSYILVFKPEVPTCPTPLASYELPFLFYNDAENQKKVTQLTRKKDELSNEVKRYQKNLMLRKELFDATKVQQMNANKKEADLRNKLSLKNMRFTQPASISDIDRLLQEKRAEADRIKSASRRVCRLEDKFRGQQDVLGKVGCLALVEDDIAAWVISWIISGDMNCVITRTTEAAQRIYNDTQGQQEVMALDAVHIQLGNRPLPHIRNGQMLFDPPGNPVYARDLLIYPHDRDSCEIVFKNLLGDTILIDDLDSATFYRRAVVQRKMPCPTILTRQGNKVSSKGKFGGLHNTAPPMNRLLMFGAPLPQQCYTLMDDIDLLAQYKIALQKREQVEQDLKHEIEEMKSPETQKKQQKLQEAAQQLKEINSLLASTPVRPVKRGSMDAGESSSISAKRGRLQFK